jgi:hypothetical protein
MVTDDSTLGVLTMLGAA